MESAAKILTAGNVGPSPRTSALLAADADYFYVFGGHIWPFTYNCKSFLDLLRYNFLTGQWTTLLDNLEALTPTERANFQETFPSNSILSTNGTVALAYSIDSAAGQKLTYQQTLSLLFPDYHGLTRYGLRLADFYLLELVEKVGRGVEKDKLKMELMRMKIQDEDGTLENQFGYYYPCCRWFSSSKEESNEQQGQRFFVIEWEESSFTDPSIFHIYQVDVENSNEQAVGNDTQAEDEITRRAYWRCISTDAHLKRSAECEAAVQLVQGEGPIPFLYHAPSDGHPIIAALPKGKGIQQDAQNKAAKEYSEPANMLDEVERCEWEQRTYPIVSFDTITRLYSFALTSPDPEHGFPLHRTGSRVAVVGTMLYLIGGVRGNAHMALMVTAYGKSLIFTYLKYAATADRRSTIQRWIWRLDLITRSWCMMQLGLPVPVYGHSVVYVPSDSALYVFGGMRLKEGAEGQVSEFVGGNEEPCNLLQRLQIAVPSLKRIAQQKLIEVLQAGGMRDMGDLLDNLRLSDSTGLLRAMGTLWNGDNK